MKINKIKIRPLNASKYGLRCLAEAYKYKGRYYYRVDNITTEISKIQYTEERAKVEYLAEAYKYKGRYYYRVGDTTIEITNTQYAQVIANPHLYYFSTALKLHCLINKKKKIRI